MPLLIARLLDATWFGFLARLILTSMFWASGLAKLINFDAGVAEMAAFGLEPPDAYNIATIAVQLIGSLLIIVNRWTWLGAGALGVFTGLSILVAHDFWNMEGEAAFQNMLVAVEHVSVIGALIVVAILSRHIGGLGNGPARIY